MVAPVSATQLKPIEASDAKALRKVGARSLWYARPEVTREAVLLGIVESLCAKRGETVPDVIVYHAPMPNAVSIFRTGRIAISDSLLQLPPDQVEAVVGHELAHRSHRKRDIAVILGLDLFAGALITDGLNGLTDRMRSTAAIVTTLALEVAGAVFTIFAVNAYRRKVEFESDLESAQSTGKPQAMADALRSLRRIGEEAKAHRLHVQGPTPEDKRPQWMRDVLAGPGRWFPDHPNMDKRIERMEWLERERVRQERQALAPLDPGGLR